MNPLRLSDPGTCKGFLHLGEGMPATDFKYTSNMFPINKNTFCVTIFVYKVCLDSAPWPGHLNPVPAVLFSRPKGIMK